MSDTYIANAGGPFNPGGAPLIQNVGGGTNSNAGYLILLEEGADFISLENGSGLIALDG